MQRLLQFLEGWDRSCQRRAVPSQGIGIDALVLGHVVGPATVHEADPLGGQGAYGGVVSLSLGDLLAIIGLRPLNLVEEWELEYHTGETSRASCICSAAAVLNLPTSPT
jgi:hypothetical protein